MKNKIHYCGSCGNRGTLRQGGDVCRILSTADRLHFIDLNKDYCSKHTDLTKNDIATCELCGQYTLTNTAILMFDEDKPDEIRTICPNCHAKFGTCETCISQNECLFETSSIPLPKMVMKTFRQGNTIVQTQAPNPDRIKETCVTSCGCWNEEYGCQKQQGLCVNYKQTI